MGKLSRSKPYETSRAANGIPRTLQHVRPGRQARRLRQERAAARLAKMAPEMARQEATTMSRTRSLGDLLAVLDTITPADE